ncbi:MAG: TlyA family RNA methyltransferase [Clostridiales bacterium]|nr:TlyA family RNA methyltransferase [Clostridiales bacterium]
MSDKKRLDTLLFERRLFESREKAKATIMSGVVYVNGQKADKAGMDVSPDADIEVRSSRKMEYVSRGGFKLEKALDYFSVNPDGLTVIDIGASTGGFSDCLLKRGAKKIYAVDVGYGQLAWSIRTDERVVCMERTNIRYVTPNDLSDLPDLAVIDVSFISLKLVLPVVKNLIKENGRIVTLIKPQFEAGREKVGKKGVVRDPLVHEEVLNNIAHYCEDCGMYVKAFTFSPIKGPEGNIEYLAKIEKNEEPADVQDLKSEIKRIVTEAHELLKG